MTVMSATPQVVAGSDFSIYVIVQNPYDIPITLYQIQTHIPVELVDVNAEILRHTLEESNDGSDDRVSSSNLITSLRRRRRERRRSQLVGIATAVGTNYAPEETKEFLRSQVHVNHAEEHSTVVGVQFSFPENPSPEELDRIMRRFQDYSTGVIPVQLEPGDTIVRQFRLRTRNSVLFTPLSYTFQIQAQFAADRAEHSCSIPYNATIRAPLSSISLGALFGSVAGTTAQSLTDTAQFSWPGLIQGVLLAALIGVAVVVGFARKSSAQSFVSIEDFWGGALIGFTVGFLGYSQFLSVFDQP